MKNEHQQMKTEIYNYLKQSQLPVKRSILLDHLIKKGYEITDRKLRSTVEEMITKEGFVIESSEKGYCLIRTEEQLEKAMQYLNSKNEAIAIRKNSLLKNWNQMEAQKVTPLQVGNQFLMFNDIQ